MLTPKRKPSLAGVLPGLAGFFAGRVIVLQFVSPLAVAFVSGYLGYGQRFYIPALLTFLGVASAINRTYLMRYAVAFGIMAAVNLAFKAKLREPLVRAAVAGGAALISGLVFAFRRDMSPYFMAAAVIEGVFTFCMGIVLQKSDVRRRRGLTAEEQISLAILSAGVVAGAMDIDFGLKLGWILLSALLMLVAQRLGPAAGGSAALIVGAVLVLGGRADSSMPVVLGIAAITAGLFRGKRKIQTSAGFIAGLAASALYTGALPGLAEFGAAAAGAAVFMLAPQDLYFNINTSVYGNDEYLSRARTVLSQRLYGFSESFDKLSRTFSALARPKTGIERGDVSRLIDDIKEKACHDCGMYTFCWRDNFYETYRSAFDILNICEEKNHLDIKDMPKAFRNSCTRVKWFADVTNRLFEVYKINMAWQNRIVESRGLISEQLGSVAKLIQSLGAELNLYMNFKTDLEDGIYEELTKSGIEVEQVIVLENEHGKYEVSIRPKTCPGRGNCIKELSRIASRVLGRRMRAEDSRCTYSGGCSMRLIEEQKFRISSGVARRAKTGSPVSGDNYSFMELRGGQCMLALSDGMGSGEKAREESAAAVELLEDFIESGFEKDMAVKMINSVLVLKSDEDSFSTLDICSIDLHTGRAEFIKIGAAATYLLRDGEVQIIKSSSLPIGMLDTVDLEISSKVLKENDVIVMVTDGVTETDGESGWISEALGSFGGRNPQDVADYLLDEAERLTEGYFRDDMTVLAARIWQR